jgi:hypothetical protein
MALPASLQHGAIFSLGCIGNRVYTGLAEDQMYFVVRGQDLEAIADVLEVVSSANAALSDYAIGDLPAVPYASTPTSDGKYLLVACMAKHLLLAIDMSTLKR